MTKCAKCKKPLDYSNGYQKHTIEYKRRGEYADTLDISEVWLCRTCLGLFNEWIYEQEALFGKCFDKLKIEVSAAVEPKEQRRSINPWSGMAYEDEK